MKGMFLDRLPSLRFGTLRLRIAVLFTILFALVMSVVMILVSQSIERFGERAASGDLAANAKVVDEILDLRAQQMRASAEVLSRDFGFREAVATGDSATIASALRSLRARAKSGSAFVVGLDGSMVDDGSGRHPPVDTIWGPLDDGNQKGLMRYGDEFALAASSPIEVPDLVGWLVVTQPLGAREMDRLAKLGAVDMQARVASQSDLPDWAAKSADGQIVEAPGQDDGLYHVSRLPALQDGIEPRLVLQHSLTEALAQYASLRYLLAAVIAAGLALVIALGFRIAGSITRPLNRLDIAVRKFARGEDATLAVEGEDEIGRLATNFNGMVQAIAEREREIIHVGLHDGLTGLPNRKLFVQQLDEALSLRRDDDQILVAYVDLDDFKVVNDTMGHPAGDALLRETAVHLRKHLPQAKVARFGGDEFAVLVKGIDPDQNLTALADEIQACFERPVDLGGHQAVSSASIGIAVAPGDGADGITLMKHADLALYRAKRDGKANHHFFEPSLDEQARRRREMELDLRLAIRDGGFELYFQPLYDLRADRLQGFEALIRWPHPTKGMVSPGEFIPLAEETGLILPIGEWVLREACRIARAWPDNLSVAVNISPKQFLAPGLATTIMQALTATGLSPERLELEITESVFIANVEKTLGTLHSLRDVGVRIALDDFGTGYSSLSYLRSFPFDKVKIDRSFVQDLAQEGNAHAVIRAITTLAEALGMDTLAEGVELPEQLEILRREGCQYIQGYLLSEPIPSAGVNELFDEMAAKPRQRATA
ncbi:EAL domain-containing protein [Erythrobacter pelagi]|jgi:diguanylate cyclase (GGDEF)-like protein|uniref:EAL domain-containing protein n=2 Tax=Qipengyuania pelagi TaxID=994320 RepID=A0A844Y3E1_9SPHN|nr:EAL domain-containing protein [Qipengyuania pelagi]MXO52511.1 EAL domain-containing protein [Qipengyuania pelagi]